MLKYFLYICFAFGVYCDDKDPNGKKIRLGEIANLNFQSSKNLTNLNHMVIDHYSHIPIIYVVGNDLLYALNGLDFAVMATIDLSYRSFCQREEYYIFCSKLSNKSPSPELNSLNTNKLLLLDTLARQLIVCGTFGGFCQTIAISYNPKSTVSTYHDDRVPSVPDSNYQFGKTILQVKLTFAQLSTTQVVSEFMPSSTLSFLAVKPPPIINFDRIDYKFVAKRDRPNSNIPPRYMYVGETYLGHNGKLWSEFQSSSLSLRVPQDNFALANDGIRGGQSRLQILKDLSHSYKVVFEYGFVAEGFAYTLTIQPESTGLRAGNMDFNFAGQVGSAKPKLHSIISRVCIQDDSFHTYVEIPLECHFGSLRKVIKDSENNDAPPNSYPILKRAYFGNVGQDLTSASYDHSTRSDINLDTRTLIAVFAKESPSHTHSGKIYQAHSGYFFEPSERLSETYRDDMAICYYPLAKINEAFTDNIRMCYNGTYQTRGLSHINPGNPKCIKSNTYVGPDFCDTTKPNPRIEGRMALKSKAIYEVQNASEVTAFTIGISGRHTVAFWGTNDGRLDKILLEKNGSLPYYSTPINPHGETFQKDFYVDAASKSIYAMTSQKVYKISIASCENYQDCLSCMEASDPYCGWCTHDNKCTVQSECTTASVYSRWLPFRSRQCVYFNSIKPERAELTQLTSVHLNISHLPSLIPNSHYICVFGESNPIKAQIQPWGLKCQLPSFEERPAINPEEGFAKVPLQIFSNVSKKIVLAEQTFTFYDCTHLTNCQSCLSAQWNCNWCLYENVCLFHTLPCQTVVTRSVSVMGPQNPTEKCPKFDYDFNPNILVPNQVATEISIRGKNLPKPLAGQSGYSCLVEFDDYSVHVKAVTNKNHKIISCQPYKYLYPSAQPQIMGKLTVLWNEKHRVDSTEITLYKCESLAADCTLCKNLDPLYKCTWCPSSNTCLHEHQCPSAFIMENRQCPGPSKLKIFPEFGPKDGGTLVTITGHDLVQKHMDELNIIIGQSGCIMKSFEVSTKITCLTSSSNVVGTQTVMIYNNRIESPYFSDLNFTYMDIELYSITPNKGPMSGGTRLTVKGRNINIGTKQKIFLDYIPCLIHESNKDASKTTYRRDINTLTCVTQSVLSAPLRMEKVRIVIDNFEKTIDDVYEYMPDPVIYSINPLESFASGGRTMLITGNSFDLITEAYLFLNLQNYESPKTKCAILNATLMICASPALPYSIKSKSAFFYETIPFGFIVDGVNSLKNLSAYYPHLEASIKYYPDPEFYPFAENGNVKRYKGESIIIEGSNMVWADEIKVTIGAVNCLINIISVTHLVCMPPSKNELSIQNNLDPTLLDLVDKDSDLAFPVWVTLGNIKTNVGYLQYVTSKDPVINKISGKSGKFAVTLLTTSGLIFIVISVVVLVIFNRRSRLAEKEYKRIQIQMETLESNVRSECKQAFAELQTDMCDVASDLILSGIPFYDRKSYVSKIFFPDLSTSEITWLFTEEEKSVVKCVEVAKENPYQRCYALLDQNIPRQINLFTEIHDYGQLAKRENNAHLTTLNRATLNSASLPYAHFPRTLETKKSNFTIQKISGEELKGGATLLIDLSSSSSSTTNEVVLEEHYEAGNLKGKRSYLMEAHIHNPYDQLIPSFDTQILNMTPGFVMPDVLDFPPKNPITLETLLFDKQFLLTFLGTLEAQPGFMVKDRTLMASLLNALLLPNLEYNVEILMSLLDKLIERSVEANRAQHLHLLMRRTESIAEKMLTNIISLYMYDYLKDYAGTAFFYLFKALKYQIEKGPVDAVSYDARYSLSEDRLLVEKVDYKILTIWVTYGDDTSVEALVCKVNDCDTITQVKNKIVETFYKNSPNSSRPRIEDLDLIWKHGKCGPIILRDEDGTTQVTYNGMRIRLNTLQHYRVSEGALLALIPRQNPYETIGVSSKHGKTQLQNTQNFYNDQTYMATLSNALPLSTNIYNLPEYSQEIGALPSKISPYSTETKKNLNNNKRKSPVYWHLVNSNHDTQDGDSTKHHVHNKISEIFLTRLLSTKGTIQKFVDDFFFTILKADTHLPCFIKYLFDYLDYQAERFKISDPSVSHSWKNNCLPLRFWVNIIKNPEFVFDIQKSHTIDSSLSVLAQTFMDSCSLSEHRLGKDSPSNKLLYAKEIPNYRKYFQKFYSDIREMPKVKDERLKESMIELSKKQGWSIRKDIILLQISQYALKYKTEIFENLESDYYCNSMNFPIIFNNLFGQCPETLERHQHNTIYDTIDTFSIKNKKGYSLLQTLTPNTANPIDLSNYTAA